MSQSKNDGGNAFPKDEPVRGHDGMSLRDWFAGQAMTLTYPNGIPAHADHRSVAMQAYSLADAMLARRSKP